MPKTKGANRHKKRNGETSTSFIDSSFIPGKNCGEKVMMKKASSKHIKKKNFKKGFWETDGF